MRILPDDSVLYAEEYNPSGRSSVARQPDCFLRDATAADARGSRRPALVFTCFVFGANNGATPPGGHLSRNRKKIFVWAIPHTGSGRAGIAGPEIPKSVPPLFRPKSAGDIRLLPRSSRSLWLGETAPRLPRGHHLSAGAAALFMAADPDRAGSLGDCLYRNWSAPGEAPRSWSPRCRRPRPTRHSASLGSRASCLPNAA
jgi:hypothetical protein